MEMPELLDENVFDILSRLPVKSLMRFKCVSKPWCSLISDPKFIKAHFSRLPQMSSKILLTTRPQASILDYEDCEHSIMELNYPFAIQRLDLVEFVGSCNGLVCLLLNDCTFMLWNPSTMEFKQLPPHIPIGIYHFAGRHPYIYGFGYDSSIDDYKLVIGFRRTKICPGYFVVQVFALKSNKWKFIRFYNVGYKFKYRGGILSNGNLHWISDDHNGEPPVVLSFNIQEEKFMEVVPLPADCRAQTYQMWLNAFENSLFLCAVYKNAHADSHHYIEVWEKNADAVEDSWKNLYRVRIELLWTPRKYQVYKYQVYFTKKHKLMLGVRNDTICIYDLEAVTCKAFLTNDACFLDVIVYLETLVSPN